MATEWRDATTVDGRLEWARRQRGEVPSVRQLALRLQALPAGERPDDTSEASAHRYQSGKRSAPWDYIEAVGRITGVDPRWIQSGEGTPDGPEPGPGYVDGLRAGLEAAEELVDALRAKISDAVADAERARLHQQRAASAREDETGTEPRTASGG